MFHVLLTSLYQRWQIRSLKTKLLLPIVGLMLISLLGSTLAFVGGTVLTQNQLLKQQTAAEAERVTVAMNARAQTVSAAAALLASDPNVVQAAQTDTYAALSTLNGRAVVVRDRFGLDLIQIYNQQGEARTNLVLSSLYRESSLLDQVETEMPVVREAGGRVLLLSRAAMPDSAGTVIAGIDLGVELNRLVSEYRLAADLGLSVEGTHIGTREGLPFDAPDGRSKGQYSRHLILTLGETPVNLLLVRPTTDIAQVTTTGLTVMIGSTLFTTLLLIGLSVVITRSIARPVQQLSVAAEALAKGALSQHVNLTELADPIGIESEDEIGLLATAFNGMVTELRNLYGSLEAKVKARTRELTTAAQVARAISSSLELDVVLRTSVQLIHERLGFYYVGIFIIEPGSNVVVLRKATSEAGKSSKAQELQIPLGSKCLVGVAAATSQPRFVQDLTAEPMHPKNPLLFDTQSAAAIPLLVGETVIGVLDVQSKQCNTFTPEMVKLLSALADQIAIGVHNARLYTQQRQTAEHLAEVDRLKTQFLAIMSHELRTPLNSVIGFSKVLLKGVDGPLTEVQVQDLTSIHEAGQHLLSLINNILDISMINADKLQLSFEEVDLQDLVESVLSSASVLVKDKPISLREDIDPALPKFYADGRRVGQILLNLLSNAIKFTESGQITIRARPIEALNPRTERVEPFVEVSVSDTGIGIPGDKQVDIFKEFTQADDSNGRHFGGAGLGLPIAKRLVELHGGWIWLKSRPGRGSTFTFILPLNRLESRNGLHLEKTEVRRVSCEA
jgi:signal transduction histidine kinase/HAMP domain-containing protein